MTETVKKNATAIMTVVGVLLSVAAVMADPATTPMLTALFGVNAAAKLSAVGTLLAALGRGYLERQS